MKVRRKVTRIRIIMNYDGMTLNKIHPRVVASAPTFSDSPTRSRSTRCLAQVGQDAIRSYESQGYPPSFSSVQPPIIIDKTVQHPHLLQ
jgi:hypothetical protein